MEDKKKLVLPGDHLASCEEGEAGQNTFTEKDEMYSSTYGEPEYNEGVFSVKRRGRNVRIPQVDDKVYCLITRADPNKARAVCMLESEVDKKERGAEIVAVLPVTNISRERVDKTRDAVRAGDIIKARIYKIGQKKSEIDISIYGKDFGVIKAFCGKCRSPMNLNDTIFVCSHCGWKETRKIPGVEFRPGGFRPRRGGPGDRRPPRHRRGPSHRERRLHERK